MLYGQNSIVGREPKLYQEALLLGESCRRVKLVNVLRSKVNKSGAIPPLPLYNFTAEYSITCAQKQLCMLLQNPESLGKFLCK
jgi:hypothetical protein